MKHVSFMGWFAGVLLAVFLCPQQVYSQIDDLEEIFDEGSSKKIHGRDYNPNILKVSLVALYFGDMRLLYERRTDRWGYEVGLGPNFAVPFVRDANLFSLLEEEEILVGWSGSLAVRSYGWFGLLSDEIYSGLMIRNRSFRIYQQEPVSFREIFLTTGFQFEPRFHFVANFESGVGVNFTSRPIEVGPMNNRRMRNILFSGHLRLGVGYSF
ncbi:MAG: hypothetical protein AAF399_15350 [Bacteroidota bacterium]